MEPLLLNPEGIPLRPSQAVSQPQVTEGNLRNVPP
jgi:hypothetical protein